jgi:hypothetical protein
MFPLKPGKAKGSLGVKTPKGQTKEAHTQYTVFGMGNNYGRASKNPQGKLRASTVGYKSVSKKQLGTKPRSVV